MRAGFEAKHSNEVSQLQDSCFHNEPFEDVQEADEKDEFDVPAKSQRKTQVFVTNSAKEAPNIADHLSPNLGSNMNLLFYNFNNSRANTASGKRAPSLGLERHDGHHQAKQNQFQLDKLMYTTDTFTAQQKNCYAKLYQDAKLIKVPAHARADQALSKDRVPTRHGKS